LSYFEKIDRAREILELPKEANLREIEKAYRKKALEFHPYRKREQRHKECREEMVQVNKAHQIIRDYIREYRFSFKKEEVEKHNPTRDMTRFGKDWLREGK